MNYQDLINKPSIQGFILIAIIIYLLFRGFQLLNKRFVNKKKYQEFIRRGLYFLEFITWIILIAEAIKYFYTDNVVVAGVLALVVLIVFGWIAWFVIKDYAVGLFIKWTDSYKVNEMVEVGGQNGKIVKLGKRSAILEINPIQTIEIAYSKLFTKKVIRTGVSELSSSVTFTLNIGDKFEGNESLEKIVSYIYHLPWANLKQKPIVVVEASDRENTTLRISASLIDDSYEELFKNSLRQKFE